MVPSDSAIRMLKVQKFCSERLAAAIRRVVTSRIAGNGRSLDEFMANS